MREEVDAELGGGLVDVSALNLHDLDQLDDSSLAHALRRLLDVESGPVAGFQSSL